MTELLFDQNLAKIRELRPEAQWAAELWMNECWNLNLKFRISEAYRTQARQQQLYAQGRTIKGPIVTYTLNSKHTQRLAVDLYPINCTHFDISEVAKDFGITHPLKFDPPHYEFDKATPKPPPKVKLPSDTELTRRAFARGIERLTGTAKQRAADRFFRQYGMTYEEAIG